MHLLEVPAVLARPHVERDDAMVDGSVAGPNGAVVIINKVEDKRKKK